MAAHERHEVGDVLGGVGGRGDDADRDTVLGDDVVEVVEGPHVDAGDHTWEVWKNDLYLLATRLFRDAR